MKTPDNGGPAFPVQDLGVHGDYGMSLRDWFAGMAMQGWVSSVKENESINLKRLGASSYEIADAMLAAREAER